MVNYLAGNSEYAIDTVSGALRHVSEVESGLKCHCICPGCKQNLIAKKGEVKQHHFSHKGYCSNQIGATETILHLRAKELIRERGKLTIPALLIDCEHYRDIPVPPYTASERKEVLFKEVLLEKRQGDIIPDCIGVTETGKQLFIEVYVTHKVDETKISKIASMGVSAVEINLSSCSIHTNDQLLEQIIYSGVESTWLINSMAVSIRSTEGYRKHIEGHRKLIDEEIAKREQEALEAEQTRQQIAAQIKAEKEAEINKEVEQAIDTYAYQVAVQEAEEASDYALSQLKDLDWRLFLEPLNQKLSEAGCLPAGPIDHLSILRQISKNALNPLYSANGEKILQHRVRRSEVYAVTHLKISTWFSKKGIEGIWEDNRARSFLEANGFYRLIGLLKDVVEGPRSAARICHKCGGHHIINVLREWRCSDCGASGRDHPGIR